MGGGKVKLITLNIIVVSFPPRKLIIIKYIIYICLFRQCITKRETPHLMIMSRDTIYNNITKFDSTNALNPGKLYFTEFLSDTNSFSQVF